MPCYDRTPDEEAREYAQRMNKVTRLLCEAMAVISSKGSTASCSPELKTWWKEHQERDRERAQALEDAKEKKRVAAAAKKKLTAAERRALGIRD